MWTRLNTYRSMLQEIVSDSKGYIEKSSERDQKYWEEKLTDILLKSDSDSKLTTFEKEELVKLVDATNEQLFQLSTTLKKHNIKPARDDYTAIENHLLIPREREKTEDETLSEKLEKRAALLPKLEDQEIEAVMEVDGKIQKIKFKASAVRNILGPIVQNQNLQPPRNPRDIDLTKGPPPSGPPIDRELVARALISPKKSRFAKMVD